VSGFTWRDGERTVLFGEGSLERSPALLAENGWSSYDLLTTERALEAAPRALKDDAARVHLVPPGPVADLAAQLLDRIPPGEGAQKKGDGPSVVALGGGRVIDVSKAIVSVRGGRAAAIPTTLAGSSITGIHRLPAGHESEARRFVRPALVIADPDAMTSSSEAQLRATAMNALAHGAESLYTPFANPVSELAALRGAELIAAALDQPPAERDRESLALGAILCAYAISSTGLALHHALCQTLVAVLGLPHAEVNATMLPHTMAAMRERAPRQIEALAGALGTPPEAIGARISQLSGGPRRLSDLGADRERIDGVLDMVEARGDLAAMTPDPPDREQLRAMIEAAF
jgi:maleylacetate reductase